MNAKEKAKKLRLRYKIPLMIVASLLALILLAVAVFGLYIAFPSTAPSGGYDFAQNTVFDQKTHTVELAMAGDALKVMIISDMHFLGLFDGKTKKLIKTLADALKPDLIICLGDQCFTPFNLTAYKNIIKLLNGLKIPWAPVFGNHDNFGKADKNKLSQMLEESTLDPAKGKYCLFRYGPKGMEGSGNYAINITKNGEAVHTFYMLDSHTTALSDDPPVSVKQITWYEWALNSIAATAGKMIPSTAMIHVPLPEFVPAYDEAAAGGTVIYGEKREISCIPAINTGMFEKILELGGTKGVFAGHDHVNDFSVLYRGIKLSYALNSGYGSYGDADLKGATLLTVFPDGTTAQELNFYR
jgi:hypothetical protein